LLPLGNSLQFMPRQDQKRNKVRRRILFSVSTLIEFHNKLLKNFLLLSHLNISYKLVMQHSCLYLVVEMYQVLAFLRIHQVLNTVVVMCIRHIPRQHPEDFRIQALMVLMLEPRPVIHHKVTVVHIHRIRQSRNRYTIIIYF